MPWSNRCSSGSAAIPGVTDAAFTSELPLTPGGSTSAFNLKSPTADGRHRAGPGLAADRQPAVFLDAGDPHHRRPRLLRRRHGNLRAGRGRQPGVCAPISRRLAAGREGADGGVCASAREARRVDGHRRRGRRALRHGERASQPEMYYSHRQMRGRLPVQTVTLLARTSGDPGAAAACASSSGSRSRRAVGRRRR